MNVLMDRTNDFTRSNLALFLHYSCDFSDTAEYRMSALNVKGESSAFASVIIKSKCTRLLECNCIFTVYDSIAAVPKNKDEMST